MQFSATAICSVRILRFPDGALEAWICAAIAEEDFWRFRLLMKKTIRLVTIAAAFAMLSLPIAAKSMISEPNELGQDQCSAENKEAYYNTFRESRTADQAKAYEAAKKYLACPPGAEVSETTQKIIDYLKKWVTAYED